VKPVRGARILVVQHVGAGTATKVRVVVQRLPVLTEHLVGEGLLVFPDGLALPAADVVQGNAVCGE
jgi:hypothetical protein